MEDKALRATWSLSARSTSLGLVGPFVMKLSATMSYLKGCVDRELARLVMTHTGAISFDLLQPICFFFCVPNKSAVVALGFCKWRMFHLKKVLCPFQKINSQDPLPLLN